MTTGCLPGEVWGNTVVCRATVLPLVGPTCDCTGIRISCHDTTGFFAASRIAAALVAESRWSSAKDGGMFDNSYRPSNVPLDAKVKASFAPAGDVNWSLPLEILP